MSLTGTQGPAEILPSAHTVLFDWDLDQFATLVDNCAEDDTVRLSLAYLPRDGVILEAGCGPGHVVAYMRRQGFDIEGIELNAAVVRAARQRFPDLRIGLGDVASVNVADGHYAGLMSFGVIEHFREGPAEPLREHWRVLRPGGIAVISVPSFTVLRRLKAQRRRVARLFRQPRANRSGHDGFVYEPYPDDGQFFEYRLRPAEFEAAVRHAGFELIQSVPTHHLPGLWLELGKSWVQNSERRFTPTLMGRTADRLGRLWPHFHNHMHSIVARKTS
jgi:SAM-dependent methyltransferase